MVPSLMPGLYALTAVAEVLGPARFLDLPPAPERQRVRRDILGDDGAGADISAGPDFYRRHERRVGADEGVRADFGAVLGIAIVIARDRAGAKVAGGADRCIADIAQVVHLGAAADLGGFDLDEIANLRTLLEVRSRTEPSKGPTDTPLPTWAPSRCEKEWITAPSSTTTPGPKTTCGSMVTSRPISVSAEKNSVSGATSVAPLRIACSRSRFCVTASDSASWTRSLIPITSSSEARIVPA